MSSNRKQFIITVGPTGSGKGRVVSSYNPFIQQAIKSHDPSYYTRGLDDLVQESPDYIHSFDKEFLPDFQTFFKENYSTKDGNIKKSLGTGDIDRLSRELGIKPREGCFTRGRIDELIEDPEMSDKSCAVRSPIKSSMDELYFRVRKTKNQDGLTYPQQNEVLVDRALREGKNIIFEITGENVDTVKALCDLPVETGKGPTLFSFPGTRAYRENPEYTHEYEIILLIPYTHTWLLMSRINSRFIKQLHEYILDYDIGTGEPRQAPRIVNIETERGLIDRVSKIYKNLQMIIDNRCVDTLLLYDNNRKQPSKLLTIFFNHSDKKGRCIKNPRNREKYNRWKRESVDIPDFTRYIGQYCSDHQSGGAHGSKGKIASWIYDATEDCFRSLTALYNDPAKKAQYGLLGNINNTFSFFNIGLTWVNQKDRADYYIATVRAVGYPVMDGSTILPNRVPLLNKVDGIDFATRNYLRWVNKRPDERPYVDYAGDIYNKWYSPLGWWRTQQDITLVLLYKREEGRLTVIDQSICNSIVDARVFCTYVNTETAIGKKTNSIITGSLAGDYQNLTHGLSEDGRCIKVTRDMKAGWKQGMVHVFTNTIMSSSTIIPRMTAPSIIGPCLSKIAQPEKNFAMMYFHTTSKKERFRKGKGVLLHYHMTRANPGGLSGNIFYFKEINFEEYPDADLSSLDGWEKIVPKDSDIFVRFSNYYSDQTLGRDKDNFGRVSCTTPLNAIEYSKGKKYITGVGHLKINIWTYLATRIGQLYADGMKTYKWYLGISPTQKKQEILSALETDHIYRFYKYSLLPWVKAYIWDSQEHIDKYTAFFILSDQWRRMNLPNFLYNHTEDAKGDNLLREILQDDGFYRTEEGHPRIIRHLHPHYIYFMIIYRLNYDDLTLKDFSNPFMIMKEPTSSFLNFPMGLTTNRDDIWISYGDGDCKSYIASFTKDKIDKLCKNNNSTPVTDIHFDMYDDL
jgi:hypothetical protein